MRRPADLAPALLLAAKRRLAHSLKKLLTAAMSSTPCRRQDSLLSQHNRKEIVASTCACGRASAQSTHPRTVQKIGIFWAPCQPRQPVCPSSKQMYKRPRRKVSLLLVEVHSKRPDLRCWQKGGVVLPVKKVPVVLVCECTRCTWDLRCER